MTQPKNPNLIPMPPNANQMVTVQKVNMNTSQELIVTTVDKAKICLMENLANIEKRNAWMTPAGILITLIITLTTTTPKDFIINANIWQAIFILGGIIASVWLIISLYKLPKSKKIDDVLKELKAQET